MFRVKLRYPLALALALVAPEVSAWDLFGHHVVCAVAWESMDETSRRSATELLLRAPDDAGLASLLPPGSRPHSARARELFLKACAWADIVRDDLFPERKERYDEPAWHYVNHFWRSTDSGFSTLPERGTLGELVGRLEDARRGVADASRADGERAIALAWVVHLVGDVHQPLHSSGRVTEREPEGDRGGNDFQLDDPEAWNLHAFWDQILKRSRRKAHSEGYFAWVSRVATELRELHPESELLDEIRVNEVEAWSRTAATIAMTEAYPRSLTRGGTPSREYRERTFALAARQAALAGYRLAGSLDDAF